MPHNQEFVKRWLREDAVGVSSDGCRVAASEPLPIISVPLVRDLREIERAVITAVIQQCKGNKAAAARVLGLHRRTLYRILQDEVPAKEHAVRLPLAIRVAVVEDVAGVLEADYVI